MKGKPQDGYRAVLLALGLSQRAVLPGARRPGAGVYGATEFLTRVKRGTELTPRALSGITGDESHTDPESLRVRGSALVLGGGDTAIDAATSALKAGAREVSLVYRRSFAEMPAWPPGNVGKPAPCSTRSEHSDPDRTR